MHWPETKEANNILLSIKDSLKLALIKSAQTLRDSMSLKGLNPNKIEFDKCEKNENSEIKIHFSENNLRDSLLIQTFQIDKTYIVLPINQKSKKLPIVDSEIKDKNATIIIAGVKFKEIKPSEKNKKDALEILKKCQSDDSINNNNSICIGGMKNKDGILFISMMLLDKSKPKRYLINLKDETCKEE